MQKGSSHESLWDFLDFIGAKEGLCCYGHPIHWMPFRWYFFQEGYGLPIWMWGTKTHKWITNSLMWKILTYPKFHPETVLKKKTSSSPCNPTSSYIFAGEVGYRCGCSGGVRRWWSLIGKGPVTNGIHRLMELKDEFMESSEDIPFKRGLL